MVNGRWVEIERSRMAFFVWRFDDGGGDNLGLYVGVVDDLVLVLVVM